MPATDVPWLGQRLREERIKRGISLRALARDVGVSASMISQIETGKSQPSVSTLYAMTSALEISIEDVFEPPAAATAAGADLAATSPFGTSATSRNTAGLDRPTTVVEVLDAFRGRGLGPVVGPDDRRVLTLDSGVTWELLGELPRHSVDFLLVTYAPGGSSSSGGDLMRHSGSEYGFLMSGELILTLGFEEVHLRPGDSVCFESTTPHRYRNEGEVPAVGVWFVIERGR